MALSLGRAQARPHPDRSDRSGRGATGEVPASPPAGRLPRHRWRDTRVLLGLLLVVGSVLLGVRLVSAADDRVTVWQATRDLSAGAVPRAGDLVPVAVGLGAAASSYLPAGTPVAGRLVRDLAAGELVPAGALAPEAADGDARLVTVAVQPLHGTAGLAPGQRVDVWATPRDAVGAAAARPTRVLAAALVAEVALDATGLGGETGVVLDVAPADVAALVGAARSGDLDLVRVPVGAPAVPR